MRPSVHSVFPKPLTQHSHGICGKCGCPSEKTRSKKMTKLWAGRRYDSNFMHFTSSEFIERLIALVTTPKPNHKQSMRCAPIETYCMAIIRRSVKSAGLWVKEHEYHCSLLMRREVDLMPREKAANETNDRKLQTPPIQVHLKSTSRMPFNSLS